MRIKTLIPSFCMTGAILGAGLAFTPSAHATLGVTWTTSAPTLSLDSITQFTVNSGGTDGNNVQNGADPATYIAFDQPGQGQTFTTGANSTGYELTSITVKQTTGGYSLDSGWDAFNGRFELKIGTISGATFNQDFFDTSSLGGGVGYIGGNQAASPGFSGNTGPVGSYLTLTLQAPIHLNPNAVYAYSIYTVADQFGGPFFSSDGTNTNAYAGGNAWSEAGGAVVGDYTGEDRVFGVGLTATAVPEPQEYAVAICGLLIALAVMRRRRVQA